MNKGNYSLCPLADWLTECARWPRPGKWLSSTGVKVETVWFCDWALNAPFRAIFAPIEHKEMTVREGRTWELLTLDRPRKRNLRIPLLFQRLCLRNA